MTNDSKNILQRSLENMHDPFPSFIRAKTRGSVLCVLSCISGVSRVFAGFHFALDIAGAISVALFSSVAVFSLHNKTSCLLNIAWIQLIINRVELL